MEIVNCKVGYEKWKFVNKKWYVTRRRWKLEYEMWKLGSGQQEVKSKN